MYKCERCKENDARVRLDSIVSGKRESHYFCRECAEQIMGGELNAATPGTPDTNSPFGGLFGSLFNGTPGGAPGAASGQNGQPMGFRNGQTATAQRTPDKQSKTPTLDQFGRDLTDEAREGKLDPAAGRDREIRRVLTVLGRRQKNNPVLIGEPGVGKTAIVEGIARRIVEGNVPANLRNVRIVTLSMGGMVAGAMFRGQFEERIKHIIEEVRQYAGGHPLHRRAAYRRRRGRGGGRGWRVRPAQAGAGAWRAARDRRDYLDEYRKHVEKDAALERRFQPVLVGEPSVEEAHPDAAGGARAL